MPAFLLAWPSSSDSSRALIRKPLLFSGRLEGPSKINDFASILAGLESGIREDTSPIPEDVGASMDVVTELNSGALPLPPYFCSALEAP
jgi:hypothetical protein